MDDLVQVESVGRKPKLSGSGQRLLKYAVKLYQEQWDWLAAYAGPDRRSDFIRGLIERERERTRCRALSASECADGSMCADHGV